jgi:hypothetical protein
MAAVKQSLLAVPEAAREDNLSDASASAQLRLQSALERRAKFFETLSNILKKTSDTSQSITQNLK